MCTDIIYIIILYHLDSYLDYSYRLHLDNHLYLIYIEYRQNKRRPLHLTSKSDRLLNIPQKEDLYMTTLTQEKPKTCTLTYFDGEFDALIGLSPQVTELDSPYYQGYLAASLEHDLVPF